jgi:pimeloyl-ACP methyl ester carboxylesterase
VKLAGLLAPDFTVVNYDRRGRGDSGDSAVYDVEREVEDLEAVIDAIGGSASVWGMSSGAALALEAAAAGLPIVKLALYEPPYVAGKQAAELPKDYEGQLRKLVEEGRRDDAVKLFMRNMGAPGFALAIMRLMPFWARLRASAHTLPYDVRVMGDFTVPAGRLASVSVPTLVIGGQKSAEALRQAVSEIAELLPRGEHRFLQGQNHNVSMEVLATVLKPYFS